MYLPEGSPNAVSWIDFDTMVMVTNDGQRIPIIILLDSDGDECEPEDALIVLGGADGLGWWTVDMDEFIDMADFN